LVYGTFHLFSPILVESAKHRILLTEVERITDGDTIVATISNQTKLRLRLLGIDAPEVPHGKKPGQPFGEEARDYLDHVIGGKPVRVDAYGLDEYKRILAVVWDDQVNVNLLMVAMGYAEVYRGAPCQVYCRELQDAEAKALE
jgi:endonuclease YncB( thermonuclease family)